MSPLPPRRPWDLDHLRSWWLAFMTMSQTVAQVATLFGIALLPGVALLLGRAACWHVHAHWTQHPTHLEAALGVLSLRMPLHNAMQVALALVQSL